MDKQKSSSSFVQEARESGFFCVCSSTELKVTVKKDFPVLQSER
jgi:hypothetical protein